MAAQRLKDKVGVITGAGTGIGRAEATLFTAEGAKIVVNDMDKEGGLETVKMIKAAGGDAVFFQADVSKPEEVKKMIEFCLKTYGKLNLWVNNAGITLAGKGDGIVTETSEEVFDKTLAVDLKGSFICCKLAIQQMLKTGGGVIVNTSSLAGLRGRAVSAYGIAKAGVLALTRSIGVSYARDNIRCNSISPGSTYTNQLKGVYPSQEEMNKRVGARIPMGRVAKPEEQAYAALFLASDESSFMTGTNIIVDGGETAGFK